MDYMRHAIGLSSMARTAFRRRLVVTTTPLQHHPLGFPAWTPGSHRGVKFHCLPYSLHGQSADLSEEYVPSRPPSGLNLGYTCDNLTLKRTANLSTSRSCRHRTFKAQGLSRISELSLQNTRDLLSILRWNADHGIFLYRVSSSMFPWSSQYALEDLPDFEAIVETLRAAGNLARATGQRLTAHPPHYIKLASPDQTLVAKGVSDLELQARVFDLMGFAPTYWNKIVIHIGGTYSNKKEALHRFAVEYDRLHPSVQARLTVENDDRPNSYSVADLLKLHDICGIPITFDLHHHAFCPGECGKEAALLSAMSTWPEGIRPVVHWSESPEDPDRARTRPHAHSAFVYGPINLFGREADVDVMVEAKACEVALMMYRDEIAPRLLRNSENHVDRESKGNRVQISWIKSDQRRFARSGSFLLATTV